MNLYHLTIFLPLATSLVAVIYLINIKKKISKSSLKYDLWISVLLFFVIYFLIVSASAINGAYIQFVYDSYDINNNGFIENNEKTDGFDQAMLDVISDTARNFAFITGAIFSLILSLGNFLIRIIVRKIKKIINANSL